MEGKASRMIRGTNLCLLVLVVVFGPIPANSSSWWSLGISQDCSSPDRSKCANCAQLQNNGILTANQSDLCRNDDAPINAISVGTRRAIVDCQFKFKNSKWNCSTFYGEHIFGKFISTTHTRETAVINAYTVAGAIGAFAEACHEQRIINCPCVLEGDSRVEEPDGTVVFQTCKDNIEYATGYITEFIYGKDSTVTTAKELASAHNIQVGKTIIDNPEKSCICHGVSGTCSVQTCHSKAPDISSVGEALIVDYNGAVKVEKNNNGSLVNSIPGRDPFTSNDLVYTDNSPNFCSRNITNGVPGVEGRKCEPDGNGPNGCQNLCCDFGFHSVTFVVPEEKCEFVWCCRIECRVVATRTITEFRCNGPNSK